MNGLGSLWEGCVRCDIGNTGVIRTFRESDE